MSRRRIHDGQEEPSAPCRYCGSDLLPLAEVGRRLGVGAKTVRRWAQRYGLPILAIDGAGRFALWSEIEEWARSRAAAR